MAASHLDYRTLSELTNHDLAVYLRKAATALPETTVSSFLLEAIECQGIPPTVMGVWLAISQDPASIVAAVGSNSRFVRHCAFRGFSKWLKRDEWRVIWELLGGVQGIIELLEKLSVEDVKLLVVYIRKGVRLGRDEDNRD